MSYENGEPFEGFDRLPDGSPARPLLAVFGVDDPLGEDAMPVMHANYGVDTLLQPDAISDGVPSPFSVLNLPTFPVLLAGYIGADGVRVYVTASPIEDIDAYAHVPLHANLDGNNINGVPLPANTSSVELVFANAYSCCIPEDTHSGRVEETSDKPRTGERFWSKC